MAINRDKVYDGAIKLLQGGKFEKAIDEFKKLIVDDPKDVRTLLKIAETFSVKLGNRKEALAHYDRAATLYSEQGFFLKAVAVFKQMLTVDATNPDLHLKLAELYQQLGYGSQCLLHYQHVVQLYEQQGRSKDTLDILKRMVDLDPENLQSRVKVAELFAQQDRVADAAAEMRSAFEYLKGQQRFDDAVRVGEKVLQWDPNGTDVALELAKIYLSRNDAKQALPKLQLCFKVDSRSLDVLELIAQAFRALDQLPKTISVYKEIARIHEGNGDADKARTSWERVLDLQPGDDDAEIALGRRAATVATTSFPGPGAGAGGPSMTQQGAPAAPAAPRMSAEDEQLQRLLTETDVYVKYGLRDKAIEHLEKIFAIRADHLPGLEKLKQLQTQTKQPTGETLKRLIAKGEEVGHPKVAEWKAELTRVGAVKKPAPAPAPPKPKSPASQSQLSSEGEVILVDEDPPMARPQPVPAAKKPAPVPAAPLSTSSSSMGMGAGPGLRGDGLDAPTLQHTRPGSLSPAANMLASLPSQQQPPDDEPLEPVRTRQASAAPLSMASPLGSDEPFDDEPLERASSSSSSSSSGASGSGASGMSGRNGRALPPDESLDEGFLPPSLQAPAGRGPPREVPRPPTLGLSPSAPSASSGTGTQRPAPALSQRPDAPVQGRGAPRAAEMVLEDALEADADALVREALAGMAPPLDEGMGDEGMGDDASGEGVPADELVLEQEDVGDDTDLGIPLEPRPEPGFEPGRASAPQMGRGAPAPAFDDGELDALAAAAVNEAVPRGRSAEGPPAAAPSSSLEFSDDEMGELQKFAENAASSEGGPEGAPAGLPAEFSSDGDDDFTNERTLAYGTEAMGRAPLGSTDAGGLGGSDDEIETGERKAVRKPLVSPTNEAFDRAAGSIPQEAFVEHQGRAAGPASPPGARAGLGPETGTGEFNPDEFDLPDDVKAMLAGKPSDGPPPVGTFDEISGSDMKLPQPLPGLAPNLAPPLETGTWDSPSASIPSLASMDADAVVDLGADLNAELGDDDFGAPPMASSPGAAPIAVPDDAGLDMPSQVRNLFAPARGFEDDPANTFFPDELAEAEFFIQQDLLDEAREILTPILEEVEDSLRVQHMLARVTAKENGEPEPPAPWEQKLIDEVGQELDDMAALSPPVQQSAPDQVSVAEVLSQFKKGIAATIPEDDAATHYDLGIAYREMGLLDDAVSEFEISARAPSKSADSWYLVALVRLDQQRLDDAVAACEKAFFSATASKDQKAAAEYQRGVIFDDHKKNGREALVCFKRCKGLGGTAPDLDRRIAALTKVHGDVDVPAFAPPPGAAGMNGSSSTSKSAPSSTTGRPKNIDYV